MALSTVGILVDSYSLWPCAISSGAVKDSLQIPIEAAVVSAVNTQTGISYSQCITDTEGQFSIKAKGNIQLYVNCLGYAPYLTSPFTIKNDTVLNIALQSSSIMLDNVLVVGEKQTPSVRVINGNTVFFPKNSAILAEFRIGCFKENPRYFC